MTSYARGSCPGSTMMQEAGHTACGGSRCKGHASAPAAKAFATEAMAGCTAGAWQHNRHAVPAVVVQVGVWHGSTATVSTGAVLVPSILSCCCTDATKAGLLARRAPAPLVEAYWTLCYCAAQDGLQQASDSAGQYCCIDCTFRLSGLSPHALLWHRKSQNPLHKQAPTLAVSQTCRRAPCHAAPQGISVQDPDDCGVHSCGC